MTRMVPPYKVHAGSLLQHVSRTSYRSQALYYGAGGANRYDDPAGHYGVLYLGFDLATALMESAFHKHKWAAGAKRSITLSEISSRLVRVAGVFVELHLADMTAPNLMAASFGLHLGQLVSRRYGHTQRISATIHAMQTVDGAPLFDGILYPSRNNFPATSIALFDRASAKVKLIDDIDLNEHREWPEFVRAFGIDILDDRY